VKTLRLLKRIAPVLAAGAILIIADGALAKGNGGHDNGSDHSQMKSESSNRDHSEMRAEKHKDNDSKHAEKMKDKDDDKHAEKTKDKDKDKTTTTSTTTTANGNTPATPAPGSDKDLFGKGIVGRTPTDIKPAPGTPASGATPGPTAINTIHPIPSPPLAPVTGSGKGIVTVSDGKGNSVIIPDHGTGVVVTPDGPGHVTISNGVESRSVSGIALNISGASAVSVDKSLGTGPRQADGSTVVLTPNGTVTGTGPGDGFGLGGFEAHVGTQTSTVQQQ